MSSVQEFVFEAIDSCNIYKKYCQQNGKSQIVTRVTAITKGYLPRSFVLHLEHRTSFHSFDSEALCINLDSEYMLPESYYDDISKHYIKHEFVTFSTYLHQERQLTIIVNDNTLLDVFQTYLTLHPERVSFISDMTFLIDKVGSWYDAYGDKISSPPHPFSDCLENESLLSSLSDPQKQAVRSILSSPVSYIWGPPGTGKTWTLAHAVLNLICHDKKVLIVAPTNNALDNSLQTILSVMEDHNEPVTQVIRYGIPTIPFERNYPQVCCGSAMEKMRKSYEEKLKSCQEFLLSCSEVDLQIQKIESFFEYKQHYEKQLAEAAKHKDDLSALQPRLTDINNRLTESKILLRNENVILSKLKQRNISMKHHTKMRFDKDYKSKYLRDVSEAQTKVDQIETLILQINEEYSEATQQEQHLSDIINSLQVSASEYLEKAKSVSIQFLGSYVSLSMSSAALNSKLEELKNGRNRKQIEEDIQYYENQLADIGKMVQQQQSQKKIYACTIDYLFAHYETLFLTIDPQNIPIQVDHAFIDEAALLPLIKAGVVFSLRIPITLCGDHKQLPPVCEMNDNLIQRNYDYMPVFLWAQSSLYFADSFTCTVDEMFQTYACCGDIKNPDVAISFLKNTFRFGDNLAAILDKHVYHNGFSGTNIPTKITVINAPHQVLSSSSRMSVDEAVAIKEYLNANMPKDYVILTPYRKQRSLLQKELSKHVSPSLIQTVHAAQGLEWTTVIISTVDDSQPFFCNSKIAIGRTVLNTAISRAIKEIVIVCDCNYWANRPNQLIGSLIDNQT